MEERRLDKVEEMIDQVERCDANGNGAWSLDQWNQTHARSAAYRHEWPRARVDLARVARGWKAQLLVEQGSRNGQRPKLASPSTKRL